MSKAKKVGRPPGPQEAVRKVMLGIRLTQIERDEVDAAAKVLEVEASTWARDLVLKAARRAIARAEG
jgi:hypothetical protein